jgi:hypothetical protein
VVIETVQESAEELLTAEVAVLAASSRWPGPRRGGSSSGAAGSKARNVVRA